MPATAFQGGFGLLTLQGIAKPSYRAFELLHRLGVDELKVKGIHDTVDAWVVRDRASATVLLTNHALPHHPIKGESIRVQLTGLQPPQSVYVERIDEDHANPKRLWIEMGKPALPTPAASRPAEGSIANHARAGEMELPCGDIGVSTGDASPVHRSNYRRICAQVIPRKIAPVSHEDECGGSGTMGREPL